MPENDNLADNLLKLDLTPPLPASVQVDRIIAGDQKRIKWLTRVTVALWIAAALGVLLIFVVGGLVFPMIAKLLEETKGGSIDDANNPFTLLAKLIAMAMVVGSLSFTVLVGAGLATVLLVFRTRRATLRQINANLLQISEQLKLLASAP